ncbi:MAG: hypothetical protein QM778_26680 [Myxococcales bacterium]
MEARLSSVSAARSAQSNHVTLVSSLEELARLDSRACDELFARAQVTPLSAISGHPRGRMLAVPGYEVPLVAGFLRGFAASGLNLWEGKSFSASPGAHEGRGFNRVRVPFRRSAFPFRTAAADSLVDGNPCLSISYDVPENPAFARATYDELRSVGPGLYLGRGMKIRAGRAPKLLVWFALDTNQQDSDPR